MARKKMTDDVMDNKPERKTGHIDHHGRIQGQDGMILATSRPRGKPYQLEEWMLPTGRRGILKVTDEGLITVYEEVAKLNPDGSTRTA